jgi:hypothetical protein
LPDGGCVHDPTDPVGRPLFNVLATVADFEADSSASAPAKGAGGEGQGSSAGNQRKLNARREALLVSPTHAGETA